MNLEEAAIVFIESCEPFWKRTPNNSAGFDLFEAGYEGRPVQWCEVKAMKGSLRDRPVGLSQTQFEHAQLRGEDYWLYVVEHAGNSEKQRIVRIQDPAGKARTFTYDHGWLSVAKTDAGENDAQN